MFDRNRNELCWRAKYNIYGEVFFRVASPLPPHRVGISVRTKQAMDSRLHGNDAKTYL